MKLVYVAGPYRAPTGWGIDLNIQAARRLGADVALAGGFPIVPHANTAHYDGLCPDSFWLDGDLELLSRCDALVLREGWQSSSGTRAEEAKARRDHIPVFERADPLSWRAFGEWVRS